MRKVYVMSFKGNFYPASKKEVKDYLSKLDQFDKKTKKEFWKIIDSGNVLNIGNEKRKQKGDPLLQIFKFNV